MVAPSRWKNNEFRLGYVSLWGGQWKHYTYGELRPVRECCGRRTGGNRQRIKKESEFALFYMLSDTRRRRK